MGTNVCEQLANVPGDVAICVAYTEIERIPLAVIVLVELPEVGEKPLGISWLLKTCQRHCHHIHSTLLRIWAMNQHRALDAKGKEVVLFCPFVCVDVP